MPRIKGQHFNYLTRQLRWIRDELRHNSNPAMLEEVKRYSDAEIEAVVDVVSRR